MTRTTLRTRLAALAMAGVLVGGLAACGSSAKTSASPTTVASSATTPSASSGPAKSAAAKVDIVSFTFKPSTVTVKVGGTVTWKQVDSVGHSVESTSKPPSWTTSPVLKPGQTFSHTFTKAGTYPYICGVHNYMTGTVVVVK